MVDLVAAYSKQTEQIKRVQKVAELAARTWPTRPPEPTAAPRSVNLRLSAADLGRLVSEYEDGATSGELADRYCIARSTVIRLLREKGVVVRHARVSTEDAALAVELYRRGMRQIDIAERLGRSKGVVWHLLRRAGEI